MNKHQEIDLHIERLGIYGEGVGSLDGLTVFVEGALPKEKIRAKLYERRKSFGRAKIVKHLEKSPHRIAPSCPYFGTCGGCQLMHLEYAEQLKAKRQKIVDALKRIGKIPDVEVLPVWPSPVPLRYRNKVQLVADQNRLGFHLANSHDVIEIKNCKIHCPLGDAVLQKIQNLPRGEGLKAVQIRTAIETQQVLVALITDKKDLSWLAAFAEKLMTLEPKIKGIVQQIDNHVQIIKGQGWIEEKLCGLSFKISPASFFQVNPPVAEALYHKVAEFAGLNGDETVLDAYCGVGTLSLFLAQFAKEVVGIECIPEAIEDARENALRNRIKNVQFYCTYVEKFSFIKSFDVAILNPSRQGCERTFLEKLSSLRPRRIVYVSCDPATLARDLYYLNQQGYKINVVQPFDMFPQTAHVETVVKLDYL